MNPGPVTNPVDEFVLINNTFSQDMQQFSRNAQVSQFVEKMISGQKVDKEFDKIILGGESGNS